MPESCDCCGQDAEDCGMDEHGWITRKGNSDFPGNYCLGCASLLRIVRWSAQCTTCGAAARSEHVAEREGWRYFADEMGELLPFCADCIAYEFGIAPKSATQP